MSKENLKNKGITLIALIITIIVMLILTGVTLSITLGDNGLVNKAKEAATQTQIAMDRELLLSAVVGALGNDGKVNFSSIVLPEGFTGSNGEYRSRNGNLFTVTSDGQILLEGTQPGGSEVSPEDGTKLIELYRAGMNCQDVNCMNEGHLHIGDYVNYSPDTTVTTYYPDGESQTNIGANTGYTVSAGATELQKIEQEELNWRVLGASGDNILLISGAPTITSGMQFYGYVGYNNYEDILNNACSTLYSKSGVGTARSITISDINEYLDGNKFMIEKEASGNDETTDITSIYDYNSVTNTLTKLPEGTTKTLTVTVNAYNYLASEYITDSVKLDLLQGDNKYYYYVASRFFDIYNGYAQWCVACIVDGVVFTDNEFSLCHADGREWDCSMMCLRPVVTLSPNVTTEDISKLETKPIETWEDPFEWY